MATIEEVKVGQIWADNDPRSVGRTLLVKQIITRASRGPYAVVEVLSNGGAYYSAVGKSRRILLRRFRPTSTGYRLVSDVG